MMPVGKLGRKKKGEGHLSLAGQLIARSLKD
jgi:hypothetical protein